MCASLSERKFMVLSNSLVLCSSACFINEAAISRSSAAVILDVSLLMLWGGFFEIQGGTNHHTQRRVNMDTPGSPFRRGVYAARVS